MEREKQTMNIEINSTYHLVKQEDLNHHGTLYAGRTAEWFVESGFIAAAKLTHPENIVCLKIHGMRFNKPIKRGEIFCLESQIVYAGKTSLIAFVRAKKNNENLLEGFITFVHVDLDGKPLPHHITIEPVTEEETILYNKAQALRNEK